MEPLLRVVELGMDVCALRAGAQKGTGSQQPDELSRHELDAWLHPLESGNDAAGRRSSQDSLV